MITIDATKKAEIQAMRVREDRDQKLKDSDWTQANDVPVRTAAWAPYRQALRDITTHSNFPDLQDSDWPTEPGA